MRPEGSGKQLERRRRRAIALLREGRAPVEVARLVGADRRSVRRWHAAYRKQGARGLAARPVPGRPAKLSARQRRQLERMLLRGAAASGFESDLWTVRGSRKSSGAASGLAITSIISGACCVRWALRPSVRPGAPWNGTRTASSVG
jgi:transposase